MSYPYFSNEWTEVANSYQLQPSELYRIKNDRTDTLRLGVESIAPLITTKQRLRLRRIDWIFVLMRTFVKSIR